MSARITRWTPTVSATGPTLAFCSVEFDSGLIVNDLKLMAASRGGHWIAMPGIKTVDRDGKPILNAKGKQIYRDFVAFRDAGTRARFCEIVIEAIREAHPEALADDGAPLAHPQHRDSRPAARPPIRPDSVPMPPDDPVDDLWREDGR